MQETQQASLEQQMQKYREIIDKHGILIVGAMDGKVPYVYTVGARKAGLPDIYMTGMFGHGTLMKYTNILFKALNGEFTMGLVPSVLGGDFNINLLPVTKDMNEFLSVHAPHAELFYENNPDYALLDKNVPQYLQAVLPDDKGVFPFVSEYGEGFEQPIYCSQINH